MVSSVIAGIGINLNQNDFTREFETPATSLKIVTGKIFDPETEAVELFREVWKAYCQIIAGESETMEEHYSHYLFKRGERALFIKGEGLFYGVLKSVDASGAALIEENGRTIRATHPGTRFYLRDKRFRN
jgi:BirA family biotin operon repressor/biotin-[acetyl-CoA-carboxylase] ligase